MRDLVAIDLPGGPAFVDALRRCWDRGDAVLPLPRRGPDAWRAGLVRSLRPTRVLDDTGETALADGDPVEDGDAVVVATSGTSGTPRGAVHTAAGIEHAAFATATALGVADDVRWLACLPLDHVGGLSVVTRALTTGAGLDVHDGVDPARIDAAAAAGATHVSLVPTVLGRIDAARWRVVLLGGSSVPPDRPSNSVATYGMTETFGGVVYDGLPLNGTAVRIAEDGRGDDGAGPIEVSTRSLLRCYRDGTDPVGPDGWYRTGDLGWIEPGSGRLHVDGRADDVVVTGGEKVWPDPVEAVLATHPEVAEVAVVGRPDPEWGQRVVAVVVPAAGGSPTLDALRSLVRDHLPMACAPRELVLVDSLPRTGIGKIRRGALAAGLRAPDGEHGGGA